MNQKEQKFTVEEVMHIIYYFGSIENYPTHALQEDNFPKESYVDRLMRQIGGEEALSSDARSILTEENRFEGMYACYSLGLVSGSNLLENLVHYYERQDGTLYVEKTHHYQKKR